MQKGGISKDDFKTELCKNVPGYLDCANKVYINVDRFGNSSGATIPLALDEANRAGRLKEGDLVLLDAFGGGFTWAATLLRW